MECIVIFHPCVVVPQLEMSLYQLAGNQHTFQLLAVWVTSPHTSYLAENTCFLLVCLRLTLAPLWTASYLYRRGRNQVSPFFWVQRGRQQQLRAQKKPGWPFYQRAHSSDFWLMVR